MLRFLVLLLLPAASLHAYLPAGFVVETYVSGLSRPADMQWGPNGLIYVAEKRGTVAVIQDGVVLGTPFVDLRDEVNPAADRGLLGLALHPDFPTTPWIYLAYVYDPPETDGAGGAAGPNGDGQRVSRIVRVLADGATGYTTAVPGSEQVILGSASTWANIGDPAAEQTDIAAPRACGAAGAYVRDCLPADGISHSIGTVAFGPDNMLYVGNGDASTWTTVDPGALRSLDLDSLAGKILRVDPDTGEGLPDNPHWDGDPGSNRSRVLYSGLRNPFRFRIHPLDGKVWIGDVGWEDWEELNQAAPGADFGWPCYEGGPAGPVQQPGYASTDACQAYYATDTSTGPAYSYPHRSGFGGAAIAGSFYLGSKWPAEYQGALFLSDYSFQEIAYVREGLSGLEVTLFSDEILSVDLEQGPDGDLYSVNIVTGDIERIRFAGDGDGGGDPSGGGIVARFAADFTGPAPAVGWSYRWNELGPLSGPGSESDLLWDGFGRFDSDGARGLPDASSFNWGYVEGGKLHPGRGMQNGEADDRFALARFSVAEDGYYAISNALATHVGCQFSNGVDIRVLAGDATAFAQILGPSGSLVFDTELGYLPAGAAVTVAVGPHGNDGCDATEIDWQLEYTPGTPQIGSPPVAEIGQPLPTSRWRVGDLVSLLGSASDPEDGPLPAAALSWEGSIIHNTHQHPDFYSGTGTGGSFVYPDHGDNSYVVLCLSAIDSDEREGQACVDVRPELSDYRLETSPPGLSLTYNGESFTTPFTVSLPVGGDRLISAPLAQSGLAFAGWSIGGDATQTITVGPGDPTLVATYVDDTDTDADGVPDALDNCSLVANGPVLPGGATPSQLDADADGYGNACDADFDNSGLVNFADLAALKAAFGSDDPVTDINGDGSVNFADLARVKAMFGDAPGPAGTLP